MIRISTIGDLIGNGFRLNAHGSLTIEQAVSTFLGTEEGLMFLGKKTAPAAEPGRFARAVRDLKLN